MWLRCLVIVACVAVASIAQTTTTNATATLTATPAPTNATTTPVPTNASNATNATTTTLVPKTYVRRRNTTVTLTRYIPSNSTTAAPNATSKPNTTAVPKRRTKTRTLPVVTSPTTPAPPPPTANGDDLNNPKMTAYVAMILTTPVATFNADSFRSTLLAAITNATLPPLLLILDYCGANATESSSVWQANNACADRVDSRYVNTLVHFGFNNADTSYYSTTNIDRTKLPLATSGSTVLFAVLAYSSLAYSPVVTPSPGVISSVTSSASSATTVFVVILIIVLVVCVACLTLQYCRKKRLTEETRRKEEAVAAAVARRRGQDATAGRGDIYEMQDRDDAEPQQHDDEHDEDDPAAKPAPVPAPKPSAAANPNGTSLFNSRPAWGQSNAGVAAGQPAPPPTAQSTYGTPAAAPQYAQQPAPTYAAQPQASPTAVPAAGMYSASNTPTTATAAPTYQYGAAATVPTAQPAVYQYGTNAAAPPTAAQPAYQYGAATTAPPAAQPTYQYGAAPAAQPTYQYGTAPQAAPYTSGTYSDPTSPADVPPERQTTQQPLYGQHATNGAAGQVSYE